MDRLPLYAPTSPARRVQGLKGERPCCAGGQRVVERRGGRSRRVPGAVWAVWRRPGGGLSSHRCRKARAAGRGVVTTLGTSGPGCELGRAATRRVGQPCLGRVHGAQPVTATCRGSRASGGSRGVAWRGVAVPRAVAADCGVRQERAGIWKRAECSNQTGTQHRGAGGRAES
jgi:hypothetical protein